MVLRRITFHHFCSYYGDQTLDLPSSSDRTLTVIVGPNNSGKTTIIRGLKFWFYGRAGIPRVAPDSKESKREDPLLGLISNRAKSETEPGQFLQAWVEVDFERTGPRGKETYALRRVIEAKKTSGSDWDVRDVKLLHARGGARPQLDPDEGGKFQRMIESLVPPALFDAFYFKGEPLDGKLLGDFATIRSALGEFLHEAQWEEVERDAAAIRDDLAKKLTKLTAANRELNAKMKDRDRLQLRLGEQREALDKEIRQQAEIEKRSGELAEKLAQMGDVEVASQVKARFSSARKLLDDAKGRLDRAESSILREINQSLGIPFLQAAVEPVREILAEMERENILPADISEPFIDRVLARSTCICGKKHDDSTRDHWEAYRAKTLATDASEGLRKLLEWVKPAGELSITQRSQSIVSNLDLGMKARRKAVADLNHAQDELNHARDEMEKVPHEEIARIATELKSLQQQANSFPSRLRTIKDAVDSTEYALGQIDDEIKSLSAKSGVDQTELKRLTTARDRADRLHQTLRFCRGSLNAYFHKVLQTSVADFYDSKATDGSKAAIDRASLLPSIQVQGQRMQNLGGGQSQLLALSYVVSLARLRQTMHSEMESLGVRLGKIDDLSFFMDSPLGNMELHYKEAAIDLIPDSAQQVVVLLWREEWEFARPLLETQADAIFAVEFHTTPDRVEAVEASHRKYAFAGKSRALIQPLPKGDTQPYSQLVRI